MRERPCKESREGHLWRQRQLWLLFEAEDSDAILKLLELRESVSLSTNSTSKRAQEQQRGRNVAAGKLAIA